MRELNLRITRMKLSERKAVACAVARGGGAHGPTVWPGHGAWARSARRDFFAI